MANSRLDESRAGGEEVRYPENNVVAIVDTAEQAAAVESTLTRKGFLAGEVSLHHGREDAEQLRAATGRRGLADLLIRLGKRLHLTDEEIEFKARYEEALAKGRFVFVVATPTDERKALAARILREQGAYTVTYMGKHVIEVLEPPRAD